MTNRRAIRYQITVDYADWSEMAQANSRRIDALRRAAVMSDTWATAHRIIVRDIVAGETIFDWSRQGQSA